MSSLFSYELDEKKIRRTLQEAEMEYSDAHWLDFDNSFSARPLKKSSSAPSFIKFNLNINRNILLPVFFIIALAGVSAIMFRFVDLKSSNNEQPAQKALVPNAGNYKLEKKTVNNVPKKEIPKQIVPSVKKDTVVINTVSTPTVVQSQENLVKSIVVKTKDTVQAQTPGNTEIQTVSTNSLTQKTHKKRRRSRTAEQIDAIQAPLNLSNNSTPEIEPELKIK